ncbi:hypothetical protein RchiOBHm_Chr1g0337501 [Rosa chinensis]|uniref:Uncharacterized protein n=1 Tax=Rosa chinensis TaxID=74649 RepID=A0A2P6SCY8_ROSCH|nr:hypothetical protein RchiOBHm_Chr1g0337501 [Rosa chinensis]
MVVFVYGDPRGVLLQHTICKHSPAPFNCLYSGDTKLTDCLILGSEIFDVIDGWDLIFDAIRGMKKIISKPSLASVVGCLMCCGFGFCFLLHSMDFLWHSSCGGSYIDWKRPLRRRNRLDWSRRFRPP